ncbi:MAG: hypothetical protein IIA45_10980, partial [Bacteroidetes bacterium]|nr:hypothetical protein [Bacteroidota bacterium]
MINFLQKSEFSFIWTLFKRLSIVMLIYTICRILFYFFNKDLFPAIQFPDFLLILFRGLRFDISAIIYFNLLFIFLSIAPITIRLKPWYEQTLKAVFYIFNFVALWFTVVDFEFYKYTLRRTTIDIGGYFSDFSSMLWTYVSEFWYLLGILFLLILIMEILYRRTKASSVTTYYNPITQIIIFIICIGATGIGARGGVQGIPLTPINAYGSGDPRYAPLVNNTPINLIYSYGHKQLQEKDYFSLEEVNEIFNPCDNYLPDSRGIIRLDTSRKDNVMIIVMESFSKEYFGIYGAEESATPFLDSLGEHALVYDQMYANGYRSVDG